MSDKFKGLMEDALGYVAVAVVSLLYIATAIFVPGQTGKSIATIIADGAASFLLGVSINFNLNMQGILKGTRSEKMQSTKVLHAKAVENVAPSLDLLDPWCEKRNAEALRVARTRILVQAGLRYEDCFSPDGVLTPPAFSKQEKKKRRALKKAASLKLSRLSSSVLTGEGGRGDDPFDFGEGVSDYIRHANIKDAVSKLLIAGVFGYFGVQLIESFSVAELVWRALQVALLLAMGVTKLYRSYLFVTDTYRSGVVRKINYLQMFENWARTAVPEREEKGHGRIQPGSVQDGCREGAGAKENECQAAGGYLVSEAAQISAAADGGAEHWHDGNGQNCRQQQLSEGFGQC